MRLINLQKDKLRNAIIYFCQNTKYFGVTKLNKLLYFLDFVHFRQTGRTVTGQKYYAWDMGPVPADVYTEITGKQNHNLSLKEIASLDNINGFRPVKLNTNVEFDEDIFSERELAILEELAKNFYDTKAEDIVQISHLQNSPWDLTYQDGTGKHKFIDYNLVFIGQEENADIRQIISRSNELNEIENGLS